MSRFLARRSLRAAVLSLLVLGLVLRPALLALCDVHASLHAADFAVVEDAASHEANTSHAHGSHGIEYDGIAGGIADLVPGFELPVVHRAAVPLTPPTALPLPRRPAPGPFRPPIA